VIIIIIRFMVTFADVHSGTV